MLDDSFIGYKGRHRRSTSVIIMGPDIPFHTVEPAQINIASSVEIAKIGGLRARNGRVPCPWDWQVGREEETGQACPRTVPRHTGNAVGQERFDEGGMNGQ